MIKKTKGLIIVLCSLCMFFYVPASFSAPTGASFLKIGAGARSAGMAAAYTALADDASALYWNPAGTAFAVKKEAMFMHSDWLEDMNFEYAGFVMPAKKGAFGLGVTYLSKGAFEGRDANRNPTGTFSADDVAVSFSMSRKAGGGSVGLNLKIISQRIESERAAGFAFDLGGRLQKGDSPLSFGFAMLNLGPQMKFINEGYNLPLSVSFGAAYRLLGAMHLSVDVKRELYTNGTNVSIGSEYWVNNAVALRSGYLMQALAYSRASSVDGDAGSQFEKMAGFGGGIGLKISAYRLDYALTPNGELGNTQRISLSAGF